MKKHHYKSYKFFGHSFIEIKFTYLMWMSTQKIFNFSTTLPTLIFFNHSHFERCEMISFMVLIYISLMTNNIEHIFLYLLAISISSLEKCPFKSLVNFLIGLLCFFLVVVLHLSFRISLYMLQIVYFCLFFWCHIHEIMK